MLKNALDLGLSEREFWEMTIGELNRYVDSRHRVELEEAKEKASLNYVHALLVGKAVAACLDGGVQYPSIHEIYPQLFKPSITAETSKRERQDELSALRFEQFAESFNRNFNKEAQNKIDE